MKTDVTKENGKHVDVHVANKKETTTTHRKNSRFITLPKIAKLYEKLFSKFILVFFPFIVEGVEEPINGVQLAHLLN